MARVSIRGTSGLESIRRARSGKALRVASISGILVELKALCRRDICRELYENVAIRGSRRTPNYWFSVINVHGLDHTRMYQPIRSSSRQIPYTNRMKATSPPQAQTPAMPSEPSFTSAS